MKDKKEIYILFVCFQIAFKILRRYAHLIQLMLLCLCGSHLPQIHSSSVRNIVDARFRLDLNDKQADEYLLGIIHSSASAIMPRIHESFHAFFQALRS
jgi:phosphatidylinositol 3-kinase